MFLKAALYLIKKILMMIPDSKTVKHENTLYVDMYAGKIKTSLSLTNIIVFVCTPDIPSYLLLLPCAVTLSFSAFSSAECKQTSCSINSNQ